MRLKYYLRGIGVGVVITTILFMILISAGSNEVPVQEASNQEEQSKTIADYEDDAQDESGTQSVPDGESQPEGGQPADVPEGQPEGGQPADVPEGQPEGGQPADVPEGQPEGGQPADVPEGQPQEGQPADTPEGQPAQAGKVRFIISGGEYSDVICKKLAEAGLIDDADAYNKFLIEENYDNYINPGVYDIPKNATYEEIAVLLTTKVE